MNSRHSFLVFIVAVFSAMGTFGESKQFIWSGNEVSESELYNYLEPNDHVLMGTNTKIFYPKSGSLNELIIDRQGMMNISVVKNIQKNNDEPEHTTMMEDHCEITRSSSCNFVDCPRVQVVKRCLSVVSDFTKVKCPSTIYIKILLVVHSSISKLYNGDTTKIVDYFVKFWTVVDLRFRHITCPNIRLSVVGIIISKDPDEPFDNMFNKIHSQILFNIQNLSKDRHILTDDLVPHFDIVVGIRSPTAKSHDEDWNQIGFSSGKICSSEGSAILIVDKGAFRGVTSAAREIGYLLGAEYELEDEFIMKLVDYNNNSPCARGTRTDFSTRSAKQIRTFFKSTDSSCLYDQPDVGIPVKKTILESNLSLDEQCKAEAQDNSAVSNLQEQKGCERLICNGENEKNYEEITSSCEPPADGSICMASENKICIAGLCLGISK